MWVEILLFLAVGVIVFYRWAIQNNDFFAKRKIPHLKPSFFYGNTGPFVNKQVRPNEFLDQMYNSMPMQKIFGFFMFRTPLLFVTDPQLIKHITVKDFDHFVDHKPFFDLSEDDIFAITLPMMTGEKWRQMRHTLSPAFTGSKMRQMFELVNDCGAQMCRTLGAKQAANLEQMDIKDLFSRFANDVIATTAFGIGVNSFEDETNDFLLNGRRMLDTTSFKAAVKFVVMTVFPWLARLTHMHVFDKKMVQFFKKMVIETIETRQREKIFRPDVVNLLMQLRQNGELTAETTDASTTAAATVDGLATAEDVVVKTSAGVKRTWTDDELVAQALLFFVAGFDTVSNALATAAYELATNPEVQEKLYAECAAMRDRLNEAGGEQRPLSYDVLQGMEYLDQVVTESLRLWPPAPFTERICVKDYVYDDGALRFEVSEKQSLWIPNMSIHRDPRFYAEPMRFEPERFGAERKASLVPGTYMPFGAGPRSCIASRFALMEMKAGLYHMVLNFRLEPCAKTQIPLQMAKNPGAFLLEEGIHLTLKPRSA